MRGLFPPWSSLLKNDYPCSLIRMHLIATSEDSIFQKEDFGWAFIQRGGFILENSKNKNFHITYLGLYSRVGQKSSRYGKL